MEENRERKFQEERLENKRAIVQKLEKKDIELSNEIAKEQGISLKDNECEIGE